jgi:DNA polymerase-3 subunit delta
MDSLTYLEKASRSTVQPVYVLHGDEGFLKRQVLAALRERVLGAASDGLGLSTYPGDRAEFADVRSELDTLPFLSPRRLVIVENADPFVTRHRAALEKYVAQPTGTGTLVLDVKSWPSNTRLAKAVPAEATMVCKAPPAARLPDWCVRQAASGHGKQLSAAAARLLVELVGADLGQLDQELAKLAAYAGAGPRITETDVDRLVGNSRQENTFRIFDAIGAAQPGQALGLLDRLLTQGEDPLRILGAFSHQLRRLAQADRLARQGRSVAAAVADLDVPPFARQGLEQQLRHLGPSRAGRLYDWLLEADLGMKGASPVAPRVLLERLVVQLARPESRATAGSPR